MCALVAHPKSRINTLEDGRTSFEGRIGHSKKAPRSLIERRFEYTNILQAETMIPFRQRLPTGDILLLWASLQRDPELYAHSPTA